MRRGGFTLIELIFVIVVIGILAAVAIPKFKNLKQNAMVANVLQPLSDLNSSGGASAFLNETELNGVKVGDLNITNILKFQGGDWEIDTTKKKVWYRKDKTDFNATFIYEGDTASGEANVTVELRCTPTTTSGKAAEDALKAKGYDCSETPTDAASGKYVFNLSATE